ncbi:MAG: phosphatase PAP2 family protein [Dehalococcoidia bacterium]|nr:phosphatase PAP2 family protein [Dehalococcoidia bacterium]
MGPLVRADETALLWLNSWVGHFPWLDTIVQWVVSDYLVPVTLSLVLLGLWFHGSTPGARERNQRGVMTAVLGLAFADLAVEVLNQFMYRPRPFEALDVSLLFYKPVDSSFPANPAAVGFAVALAVWTWNRKIGVALLAIAVLFSLARVYAGVFYPLDILGGAAVGAIGSLLGSLLMRWAEPLPGMFLKLARSVYLA